MVMYRQTLLGLYGSDSSKSGWPLQMCQGLEEKNLYSCLTVREPDFEGGFDTVLKIIMATLYSCSM